MPKKEVYMPIDQVNEAHKEYKIELATNPEFSLEVDPLNKYNFTSNEKKFIKAWVDHKNLPVVAQICELDEDEALYLWEDARIKDEVRRLNRAIYHGQFENKLAGLDDIGGYLTSLLMDECTESDRLVGKDKLQVVRLLLDVNKLKQEAIDKGPQAIETVAITEELNSLSVKDIKSLITKSKDKTTKKTEQEQKEEIINSIEGTRTYFQPEEREVLMNQSIEQLLKIKEDYDKKTFEDDE